MATGGADNTVEWDGSPTSMNTDLIHLNTNRSEVTPQDVQTYSHSLELRTSQADRNLIDLDNVGVLFLHRLTCK